MAKKENVTPQEAARRGWLLNMNSGPYGPICYVCSHRIKSKYVAAYPFVAGKIWYTHTGKCASILDKSLTRLAKMVEGME